MLNTMDEIRNMSRPTDVPDFGLINDLLWSDPIDSPNEWEDNDRGVSYCYNKVAINKFINKFNFDLVCRAHMVVEDGYEFLTTEHWLLYSLHQTIVANLIIGGSNVSQPGATLFF